LHHLGQKGTELSIIDFRTVPADTNFEADICIVGSGPAGLTIALQFADSPIRVCVVESGGLEPESGVDALSTFEAIGQRRSDGTRARGLGGTSALWTGRCGVFDPLDYQARPWVAHSGWPITQDDVEPFYDRAGRVLGLGPAIYKPSQSSFLGRPGDRWNPEMIAPVVWQFSQRDPSSVIPETQIDRDSAESPQALRMLQHSNAPRSRHLGVSALPILKGSRNIEVLLHASATSIETNETGAEVRSVSVSSLDGKKGSVSARRVVLACGGVDNARLLLCSRSTDANGLGNGRGLVGRFLSDHPFWQIASYSGEGSKQLRRSLGSIWLDRQGVRHVYVSGIRFSAELQCREHLLNCAVHIVELGNKPPAVAHAGNALRLARKGAPPSETARELVAALSNPVDLASGVYARYIKREPTLALPDAVAFGCVVEQVPDPESRVRLSDQRDALGMNRALIDWRVSDREFDTAKRMAEILRAEMDRLGYKQPDFAEWLSDRSGSFRQHITDMAHPTGTTRMSADASHGVVDANCEVHGVSGLYVAGSSVFSTSAYMNPTLMIVTLALRLADHLKTTLPKVSVELQPAQSLSLAPTLRRARIGIVGAGDRVRKIYVPILRALEEEFEIVGFTTRSGDTAKAFATESGIAAFPDAATLVASQKPDILVVAINQADQVLPSLVGFGIPLLVETPFAWNLRRGRKTRDRIKKLDLVVGVAEQTPFLPLEQLKKRILDLGLLGRVISAHNDFAVNDYHGIAALRAYLGADRLPLRANAIRATHNSSRGQPDTYLTGTATYATGSTLSHQYGAQSINSNLRDPKTLRLYGTTGAIVDNIAQFERADGSVMKESIRRSEKNGRLCALSVMTPVGEVSWRNPFCEHDFSDEMVAVGCLLRGVKNAAFFGGAAPYTVDQGLGDMEILTAMRYSAEREGAPEGIPSSKVRFPYSMNRSWVRLASERAARKARS
jgi:choline dehydrogenase-like flavoprotein/predicted dehydrogenase